MKTSPARSRITSLAHLEREVARARRTSERIVFTNGCFDLLHTGHVRSLEAAARLGDRLIVAINDDASIRRAKGLARPIQPARVRRELVAALACVDWVIGFRADTPIHLIRSLRPDVLAKGGDWALDDIVGREEVESWGGRVVRLAIVPGERSSDLIERIRRSSSRRETGKRQKR
jgi:D-beta-D-heptose 7-phosphate kinase/D-beta-D-heptose 1-phosphate adenosyltransferase